MATTMQSGARRARAAEGGYPVPAPAPAANDEILLQPHLSSDLARGRLADPFAVLGPHRVAGRIIVRTFQPGALAVEVLVRGKQRAPVMLGRVSEDGLFAGVIEGFDGLPTPDSYCYRICWPAEPGSPEPVHQYTEDPYAFGLLLGELDLHLIGEGRHLELGRCLGAQTMSLHGVAGTRFAVWAPNARRVSVVGDFNGWDGRRHPMRLRYGAGIWEIFVPRVGAGACYMVEIVAANGELLPRKADPVARTTLAPPATASVVAQAEAFMWSDAAWLAQRAERQKLSAPISIYEVHAASWQRHADGPLAWDELAERLIPYAKDMGFTHIELMPVMEHPFGGSWGYQPLAQFAPTARLGAPAAFAAFVDRCHGAGLGVILDWVPAHFPHDTHGLANFDGTPLYEHADPREGRHPDWNTLIYNLGRKEVSGFLIASALEWLERFHVDGLRVDAVSSMLYRDYSRKPGEWVPNARGGRENLEAIAFLRELNRAVAHRCPGALVIAEESTAWPGVSAPVEEGGLGFSCKWNMGWMHDSLRYVQTDPLFRGYHHHDLTFGLAYAFSERFVLPISHDEVVHGKGSLLNKMPGDLPRKLAGLRAYLGFMWTHPGKKLLFMGCEFGQLAEWNHDASLQWDLLRDPGHRGVQSLVRDLNRLYASQHALHDGDCDPGGFAWLIADDSANSVYAYLRKSASDASAPRMLVVCNMTPVAREGYRIGVPEMRGGAGEWREVLNTDSHYYGGGDTGNFGAVNTQAVPSHGRAASIVLTLPPLTTLVLAEVTDKR
ncbi:MAG: glgB [Noviherbaspirillum sp.]|nr:glgB [Noviherbaspirillum sp.]